MKKNPHSHHSITIIITIYLPSSRSACAGRSTSLNTTLLDLTMTTDRRVDAGEGIVTLSGLIKMVNRRGGTISEFRSTAKALIDMIGVLQWDILLHHVRKDAVRTE
jgi:hypothetical protein